MNVPVEKVLNEGWFVFNLAFLFFGLFANSLHSVNFIREYLGLKLTENPCAYELQDRLA